MLDDLNANRLGDPDRGAEHERDPLVLVRSLSRLTLSNFTFQTSPFIRVASASSSTIRIAQLCRR